MSRRSYKQQQQQQVSMATWLNHKSVIILVQILKKIVSKMNHVVYMVMVACMFTAILAETTIYITIFSGTWVSVTQLRVWYGASRIYSQCQPFHLTPPLLNVQSSWMRLLSATCAHQHHLPILKPIWYIWKSLTTSIWFSSRQFHTKSHFLLIFFSKR